MLDKSWLLIGSVSGLIFGLIQAFVVGFCFKSVQPSLWILLGSAVGTIIVLSIFVLNPTFLFQLGLWVASGKDVFGSSILGSVVILVITISLGSICGGLICFSIWLKLSPN
jgi:hypothetical protein